MIRRLIDFPGWESFAQISYSICRGLVQDNVCRARRSGHEDGQGETMLLKGEIGSSATFLLGARTRFGRVITLQQSFDLLNTSCRLDYQPLFGKGARAPPPNSSLHLMGLTTLSSGYSKFFFERC